MHTHIYIYLYTYIIYLRIFVYVCMCIYTYMYAYMYILRRVEADLGDHPVDLPLGRGRDGPCSFINLFIMNLCTNSFIMNSCI